MTLLLERVIMKYSIIIPVYNVENFLKECIDSVLKQKYRDFEIILVDDGSTDNSGKMCDTYSDYFNFIKVVHKENGGAASARNVGVKMAEGDYIIFLDSDDYWMNDSCLLLINESIKQTRCDILVWNSCKYYQNINKFDKRLKQTKSVKLIDPNKDILNCYEFKACPWDKAINRNVYEEKNYSFQEGVLSEDVEWTFDLLKDINSVAFLDYQINIYRQRAGSVTKTQRERNAKDMIAHVETLLKQVETIEKETLKNNCYAYIAEQYANCIIMGGKSLIIKQYAKFLKSSKYLLEYGKTKKNFIMKYLLKFLGFKITCILCGTAFDMKNNFVL